MSEIIPQGNVGISDETPICAANIKKVVPGSPADDAGFYAGCDVLAVNGYPIRDIIDWRWYADDETAKITYREPNGYIGEIELERENGQEWGIEFDGIIFDSVKLCRNACTFCFMRQLPEGMRRSLSMRDDDFRLSFLTGTFVTLTNVSDADISRIIEQHISPIRMSLHAIDHDVRKNLIGKHHEHGLRVLDQLLDAGIEIHAQIVLVPNVNDNDVLIQTLNWAYSRKGITDIGIVPLGYTDHQNDFDHSFNDASSALSVLKCIEPFQKKALIERENAWVYAADEFYLSAYGDQVLDHLPDADFYNGFPMFEDGIGIVRSCVDDFNEAVLSGEAEICRDALKGRCAYLICGKAMAPYMDRVLAESPLSKTIKPLFVENSYFGGNVNVTGLLCGCDMISAICKCISDPTTPSSSLFLLPRCAFNDDMITLDGMDCAYIRNATGAQVYVISSNPLDCIKQIPHLI